MREEVDGSCRLRYAGAARWLTLTWIVSIAVLAVFLGWWFSVVRGSRAADFIDSGVANQVLLVPAGSTWMFWDLKGAPPADEEERSWFEHDYDDSAWHGQGPSPLGFGDGNEATTIGLGRGKQYGSRTAYFRHAFDVQRPDLYKTLVVSTRYDDGVRVCLNGHEILRRYLRAGTVQHRDFATVAVRGLDELRSTLVLCDAKWLTSGRNVVSAEVHQWKSSAEDMKFSLELVGVRRTGTWSWPRNVDWKMEGPSFLDSTDDQGRLWYEPAFDDQSWKQAFSGDGAEPAAINCPMSSNGIPASYLYRYESEYRRPLPIGPLCMNVLAEAPVSVYLNGRLLSHGGPALRADAISAARQQELSHADRLYADRVRIPDNLARPGVNTLAVKVVRILNSGARARFDVELRHGKPPDPLDFAWCGGVTSTSAVIHVRSRMDSDRVRLWARESGSDDVVRSSWGTASIVSNDRVARLSVSGLRPDAPYDWGIEFADDGDADAFGSFRTFPRGPASYTFAVGSCARTGSNHPVFDDIRESRPLFYLMLGDLSYADVVYDNPDLYRLMFRNVLERSRQKDLYRNVPIVYMWDDHDYGQQGRQGTRARISSARLTYQEYVPHYPLARGRGNVPIYQSFSVGRSFFIVTDLRSERSSEFLTDGPSKSMMGSTQKAWFKEQLLGAAAEYPVIFWACTVPWLVQKKEYADSWGGYTDERTEIANFIRDHELAGRLIILGGDAHMVALDDGTNSDFATGGGAPVPVFHAGAVHQSGSRKGGPYSHGRFTNRTSGVQCDGQFGLVTVTDDAGDAVNVRIRGMRREHDTDELVQLIEWQRTYSASGGTTMRTEPLQSAARIKATP